MFQRAGRKPFVTKLLSSTMLGGLAAIAAPASPALAACSGSPTVTCSGATTSFGNGTQDNLTINVQAGATITNGAGDAVVVRDSNIINLQAATSSVISTNNTAITMQNGASQINNTGGTISGGSAQAIFWQPSGTGASLSINNSGIISGTSPNISNAISGGGGANVLTITNSGTISGNGANTYGVFTPNTNVVLTSNTGTITGGQEGILANALSGTNGVGGTIGGATTLIGAVSQSTGGLNFTNLGTIQGTNMGIGSAGGASGSTLINAGTITSGGNAVAFDGSNNTLELRAGSTINGTVNGGIGGTNNVLRLGGSADASFNASNIDTGALTQQYQHFDTFQKQGTSNWTLLNTGAQTWAVSGGTLTGTTTSASGNKVMSNGANFALVQGSNGTYSGVISGAGNLIKGGAGTVTLGVAQTYSGTTAVNGGTLQLGGTNFLPIGTTVTITSGAFNLGGFAQTVAGVTLSGGTITNGGLTGPITATGGTIDNIAGSASAAINGSVSFGGINTYAGATIINALASANNDDAFSQFSATTVNTGGTLQLNGNQTINNVALAGGTITGGVLNGAVTSTGGTIANTAGTMSLTANSGTTQMGAGNAYTGATVVNSGATLQGTAANAFSAASATTVNTGGIVNLGGFAQTINSVSLAGGIIQNGALTGAIASTGGTINGLGGSTTLTTTSGTTNINGTNTFSGLTSVNGGLLSVNGSMTSAITVNAGGTLGGTGTAGPTTINGGKLAPGNSIGTIQIAGNLSFVGAGNYLVEVSPSAADRTNVTGTASLGGTIQFIPEAGAYTIGTRYTVLNATGGVSGTFGTTTFSGSFGGSVNPRVEYDANNVYLVLAPNSISPFLVNGTRNQRAVVGAIDTALGAGNVPPLFLGLFGLTAAQLPAALDQLSGEVHATTQGALVDESLYARSAILGRLRQASYGGNTQMASLTMGGPQAFAGDEELNTALAYGKSPIVTKAPIAARPEYDTTFWAQGFGAKGRFDGDGNATNVRRDLAGFFSGVDTRIADGRLGIAAGYTGSRNNLDGRGSSNVETGHIAGYGGWSFGALNLRAGGDFAWHQIDTSRTIAFPGFFDTATASYKGRTGQVFGEAGYGFAMGNMAVEPFAGGAWVHLSTDGFTERALVAGLNGAANAFEVGYSNVGIRAASMIPLANDMMLVPRGSVSWQHAFNDVTPDARLALIAAPVPFVVAGTPIARDAILGEAGLDLAFGRSATIGVSYTGQLARNVQDHAAKGKFSWKF